MEKCVGSRKRAKSTQQKEGETMQEAKPQNPHPFLPWACQPVSSGVSFAPSHIRALSLAPSALCPIPPPAIRATYARPKMPLAKSFLYGAKGWAEGPPILAFEA